VNVSGRLARSTGNARKGVVMKTVFYIAVLGIALVLFVIFLSQLKLGAVSSEVAQKLCGVFGC